LRSKSLAHTQRIRWKVTLKAKKKAGHWWLMPAILATQKAEISRIAVQSQLWQIDPISKKSITKNGW
jgi:hypothetical protein